MSNPFFDHPILNSPYECPRRHWELDDTGQPTQRIAERERIVERLIDAIEPDESQGEPPLLPILNRYMPIGSTGEVNFKTTRPCHGTQKSHLNQVVLDTASWEQAAAFYLEQSERVTCYARNDHLECTIPYEYLGVSHVYIPDYLARLENEATLVLEVKGWEDEQDRAKHQAARRWVSAVNNWGKLGAWQSHVCRNPQMLGRELETLAAREGGGTREQ
ncbi:MAG: PDDEXK family nuclease [Deferrisomatales bacterium]